VCIRLCGRICDNSENVCHMSDKQMDVLLCGFDYVHVDLMNVKIFCHKSDIEIDVRLCGFGYVKVDSIPW